MAVPEELIDLKDILTYEENNTLSVYYIVLVTFSTDLVIKYKTSKFNAI